MNAEFSGRCLVEAVEVHFGYSEKKVIQDISLEIHSGEMVAVAGPNGSGKTTLLKLLCGLLEPDKGEIKIDNRKISSFSPGELARKTAYVPQHFHLDAPFTVSEVVMTGRHSHVPLLAFESSKDKEVVKHVLEESALFDKADCFFQNLSGGEKQRVCIAAALAQEPKILILDEPTSGLDPANALALMNKLKRLAEEHGTAVVAAVHDLNIASYWFPRLVLLRNGQAWKDGDPFDVLTETTLEKVYSSGLRVVDIDGARTVLPSRPKRPEMQGA